MLGHFGFSYVGLLFLLMLIIPNLVWTKKQPQGYSAEQENRFLAAFVLMVMYEIWWARYFRSERRLSDFYSSLFGIPVAGATLPVSAFFLLGIYGKVIWMLLASVILGIGHIGIHLQHRREIN